MANLVSLIIVIFFFWGRSLHSRNLRLHILVMTAVIAADLALVIFLVLNHDALGKVDLGMPWTLKVHVPIALFTVIMYLLTGWTGFQLYRGKPVRARMRAFDRIVVPARVLTLITSIMVQYFATR